MRFDIYRGIYLKDKNQTLWKQIARFSIENNSKYYFNKKDRYINTANLNYNYIYGIISQSRSFFL